MAPEQARGDRGGAGGLGPLPVRRGGLQLGLKEGVWKDRPRHDDASHGADAFLNFACSGYKPPSAFKSTKRDMRWVF
jgi:hypothetical protein